MLFKQDCYYNNSEIVQNYIYIILLRLIPTNSLSDNFSRTFTGGIISPVIIFGRYFQILKTKITRNKHGDKK